ncbi:methyl-accepting chemotaxis protein [Paracoccus sp. (in: a-proteobacteria)]|uniref:methyl-accepting chemotaxis protein n=1 Tax=Paracoccus sp. TaxID=267 RepID=UPI00272A0B26|nr:methyl-accepting chemotaxis protein [Paracoccus sp. (in: a-proteobacteria)]
MNFFSQMSLKSRLVTILVASITTVALLIALSAISLKTGELRRLAATQVDMAISIFAADLARSEQGFVTGSPANGHVTALVLASEDVRVPTRLVDQVSDLLEAHVTYFALVPENQQFLSVMTSIRAADGSRAIGTVLDPNGDAHEALIGGRAYAGEAAILGASYLTRYEPVLDATGRVVGAVFAGKSTEAIHGLIFKAMLALAVPTLILIALAFFASRFLIRRTLRPVRDLAESVKRLEQRDYDVAIPPSQTRDEIGDLSSACLALRDDLREAARLAELSRAGEAEREARRVEMARVVSDLRSGLSRLADGDLMSRIPSPADNPFPSEYEPLRHSFNTVIDRFDEVINQVSDIARSVRDSAVEIADASRELSGRAETQAATLEQSAAALTELTHSVASTADRATQAQDASFDNRTGAERGAEIVREAVAAMHGIEKGSEQITRIIGVIEDIAFQTNLLALNAGVEAARAGDAGRGFAVVASEVRLLAQRAAESAREIKGLISDSTERVEEGSNLVRRTGDSLSEILGRASEAASLVADIALAAAEQARGLAEVNAGVNQLDHVTQQNSAVAEETSAAAATLQSRSEELMRALSGFRTGQRNPAPRLEQPRIAAPRNAAVEANVVDWSAAAAAAVNGPRATPVRQGASWAEF